MPVLFRATSGLATAAVFLLCASLESQADNAPTLDWVPLDALSDEQRAALPPGSCGAYISPEFDYPDANADPQSSAIRAGANQSLLTNAGDNKQHMLLIGDVVITQGYRQLRADKAEMDQANGELLMEGNLEMREPGLLVLGDRVEVRGMGKSLEIDNATYVLKEQNIRGSAAEMHRPDDTRLILRDTGFTTCEPGNNSWVLKGSKIVLDSESRQGSATHVRFIVKGIPVFYFPYLRFPLGSERLTGFLAPTVDLNDEGNRLSVPFYFNLAPHYDWTLTPHWLEANGLLWENNLRHLSPNFYSQLNFAYLADDKSTVSDKDQSLIDNGDITLEEAAPYRDEDRWMINFDQLGGSSQPWRTSIDYTEVSDIDFFDDFDTSVSPTDSNYVNQKILTGYDLSHWSFDVNGIRYQTLSDSIATPYQELPEVSANGFYQLGNWDLSLNNEWTRFTHKDDDRLTGDRLNTSYRLGWAAEPQWGFLRPAVKLKHLQYRFDEDNLATDTNRSPAITVPQFTLDSGLFFERNAASYQQTFEPRLFYFYSDYEDHSELFDVTNSGADVDFDTSNLSFTYSQLFRDTRFSGGDRIDDANQLSIGLTTRFIGYETGLEWFSASVGQIRYFEDRRVNLTDTTTTEESSVIAAQLSSNPSHHWRISNNWLYDDNEHELLKANINLRFQGESKHLFEFGYHYNRGATTDEDTNQFEAAFITPVLNERWHLLYYGAYDETNNRELVSLAAIEYDGCCYRLRTGYQIELDNDLADTLDIDQLGYDESIFIELHFKGLGGTGKQLDKLFDENIDGYLEWQAVHHPDKN